MLKIFEWLGDLLRSIWEWFSRQWQKLVDFLGDLFKRLGEWLGNVVEAIGTFLKDMVTGFWDYIKQIGERVSSEISQKLTNAVKNKTSEVGKIDEVGEGLLSSVQSDGASGFLEFCLSVLCLDKFFQMITETVMFAVAIMMAFMMVLIFRYIISVLRGSGA